MDNGQYMAQHNKTGNDGEEMAVNYLIGKGYSILHRNWRYSRWEIDIIASNQNKLHFIEVKTRRTDTFGHPEESITKKKMRFLMQSAEQFLFLNPQWKKVQFDVVSVTLDNDKAEFFFIEDIYL